VASSKIIELIGDQRNVDPFRLAILGFAKIEEGLNEALEEAFDGELPKAVRDARFGVRVAVATALGLVPDVSSGVRSESSQRFAISSRTHASTAWLTPMAASSTRPCANSRQRSRRSCLPSKRTISLRSI
jgi:hypothetical protein